MTRIRVVDFETNGTAPPAEVIEVGICDVVIVDAVGVGTIQAPLSRLCGVSTPVTCETRAVHHITPVDLVGLPPFVADEFWEQAIADGVTAIAAHHADFEGKWLGTPRAGIELICTYKGALRVFPEAPAHGNQTLRYWFEEQGHSAIPVDLASPAHRAGPDAFVTAHLLGHLLSSGRATLAELVAWTAEPAVTPRCSIGKWRGRRWEEVDAGFLSWMLRQPDMDRDLKWNAQREIGRRAGAVRG
jgi:exodeoxyribonuclease X